MRNKMKITAKEEQARPALVPKLRFPEFRNLRGWSPTALYVIADPVTERAIQGEEDNVLSLSTEHGIVLQSEFFGKKVAGDNSERYLNIARNDFVYNDRTTKASTFGTIKRLSKHSGGIVSPIYKCFRFHTDENPVFWEQYFETGNHDSALCGLVNEGARAGRFNISIRQFLSTAAPRPAEAEQQKIAKCLSSVDELIAAQERKVDALKTYKKGLMQQLFPRKGETQPLLRFPEFENDGEWEDDTLGAVCELYQAVTLSSSQLSMTGEHLVYGANGVIGTHNEYNHEESEIAVTCRGATCGEMTTTKPKSWITGNAMVVKPRTKKLRKDFIFQYFKNHGLKSVISGSAQPPDYTIRLRATRHLLPKARRTTTHCHVPEQHRCPDHHRNPKARSNQDPQERADAATLPMPRTPIVTHQEVANQLKAVKENIVLVYAFNATGKTRLSVAYKDTTKGSDGRHSGVYYNAFSEDIFVWDNDTANNEASMCMLVNESSLNRFHGAITEDAVRKKLEPYKPAYDFFFNQHADAERGIEYISFFIAGDEQTRIKISRGEERIFVWCFFLALFEVEGWADMQDQHFFIDDPVSSLDDHNIFITASTILDLIDAHFEKRKVIITTHHIGLFAILYDWLKKGEKAGTYSKATKPLILSLKDGQLSLKAFHKEVFLYHLHLLQILNEARASELQAFHFAMLRQVLENVASFLGVGRVGFVLEQLGFKPEERVSEIVNFLSHKNLYRFESAVLVPDNKKLFEEIFDGLMTRYNFVLHAPAPAPAEAPGLTALAAPAP